MSLFYRTDRKIMFDTMYVSENSPSYEHRLGKGELKTYAWMKAAMEKGVSFDHIKSFGPKEHYYYDDQIMLCDWIRKGYINVQKTEFISTEDSLFDSDNSNPDTSVLNEGFVTTDEKQYLFSYSVDLNHPSLDKALIDYVKNNSWVKNKASTHPTAKSFIDNQMEWFENRRNFSGFSYYDREGIQEDIIHNLRTAFERNADKIEVILRDNLSVPQLTQNLSFKIHDAHYETLEKNDKKVLSEIGSDIMHLMKGVIIAHRGHSSLYAFFHPFKYRNEVETIESAKRALGEIGLEREKIENFVKKVELQDEYLRDKKDLAKFHELDTEDLYKFDVLKNGIAVEEKEIVDSETEKQFENNLQLDTSEKKSMNIEDKEPVSENEIIRKDAVL